MEMSKGCVAWLLQAGRLLQAKPVTPGANRFYRKIIKNDGESYPEAVLREIHAMPADLQSEFFDVVDWALQA